jgi:hypothetical protein
VVPYSTSDYKKYCYAKAVCRMERIFDLAGALETSDAQDEDDFGHVWEDLYDWLYRATFCDDHRQAAAHDEWVRDQSRAHAGQPAPNPALRRWSGNSIPTTTAGWSPLASSSATTRATG